MYGEWRVFDVHVHIQPWEMLRPGVRQMLERTAPDPEHVVRMQRDPKELLAFLDAEGVDRAVLVNYVAPEVTGTDERVNPWIGGLCKAAPDRLVAMGGLHPSRVEDPKRAVDELLDVHGVRAFKLHPSHQGVDPCGYLYGDEKLAAIYKRLEERDVPMTVHTGTSVFPGARNRFADPMRLDDVAVDFPKLRIVLAHAGRPLWCPTAHFLARRHPNVYLDLSGIPPKRLPDYLPRLPEVADKSMFGSDWPGPGVPSIGQNVKDFLELPLPERAKQAVLYDTAARVFG